MAITVSYEQVIKQEWVLGSGLRVGDVTKPNVSEELCVVTARGKSVITAFSLESSREILLVHSERYYLWDISVVASRRLQGGE